MEQPELQTEDQTADCSPATEAQPEEVKTIIGPRGIPLPLKGTILQHLTLSIQKFTHPNKYYRLAWRLGPWSWLCKEDETPYRRRWFGDGSAVEAGEKLAKQLGVKFESGR